MLLELPVGFGIKGGVARKVLKVLAGGGYVDPAFAAEMNGGGDVDILVAVPSASATTRRYVRSSLSRTTLGGMVIEPKDIEVCYDLEHYFLTRDITLNEALLFRWSPRDVVLLYSEQAWTDAVSSTIRPSVHCVHNGFSQVWFVDGHNNTVITPKPLARCILRYLKGHGVQYDIPPSTWTYYREVAPLTYDRLFLILKAFVEDDEKMRTCVAHLEELGLLEPGMDMNHLWGACVFAMNTRLARVGRRLTFSEPGVDAIERWIDHKREEYEAWCGEGHENRKAEVHLPVGWSSFPVCADV